MLRKASGNTRVAEEGGIIIQLETFFALVGRLAFLDAYQPVINKTRW